MLKKKALLRAHPLLAKVDEVKNAKNVSHISYHILDSYTLRRPVPVHEGEVWVALADDSHYIPLTTKSEDMPKRYRASRGWCLVEGADRKTYRCAPEAVYDIKVPQGGVLAEGIYAIGTYDPDYIVCIEPHDGSYDEIDVYIYVVPYMDELEKTIEEILEEAIQAEVDKIIKEREKTWRRYKGEDVEEENNNDDCDDEDEEDCEEEEEDE